MCYGERVSELRAHWSLQTSQSPGVSPRPLAPFSVVTLGVTRKIGDRPEDPLAIQLWVRERLREVRQAPHAPPPCVPGGKMNPPLAEKQRSMLSRGHRRRSWGQGRAHPYPGGRGKYTNRESPAGGDTGTLTCLGRLTAPLLPPQPRPRSTDQHQRQAMAREDG